MTKLLSSAVTVFVCCCLLSSCSVTRVIEVPSPTANRAGSGQCLGYHTNIQSSFWKSKNKLNIASTCSAGISRVKVTIKPGNIALAFLTLGFVVKQHIDWDCSQRTGSGEIL